MKEIRIGGRVWRWGLVSSVAASLALFGGTLLSVPMSSAATPKVVKVMYWENFDTPGTNATPDLIKTAAKELAKQHPGTTVELEPITTDDESTYYAKIDLAQRSAATAPDVVMEDSFLIGSDASAGFIQPIPQVTKWSGWTKFPKAMQQISTYNGKIYGVMNCTDIQLAYYNKVLFKKAGIPVPWQPHSLADIESAAKKLSKVKGIVPTWLYTGTPLGEASSFRGFEVFLDGSKDRLYNNSTKKWEISGPGFTATWNFLAAMKPYEEPESDWSNPNASTTVNDTLMPKNEVGITFDGSWDSTSYLPGGPAPSAAFYKDFGVASIPAANGGYTNQSGGFMWSLSTHSAQPKLGLQLIEDMSSASNLAEFNAKDGNIPPRTDATTQPQWAAVNKVDPILTFATDQLPYTNYRPNLPAYPQISNEIAALTGDISDGSMTASQAEAAYAAKVTQIVGKSNTQAMTQ
jgi:multiple sugar transport system substrate-binding protein